MKRWHAYYDDGLYKFYKEGIELDYWTCGDTVVDALNKAEARIAELEHDLTNKEIEYTDLWDDALALQSRIAELEVENNRLAELLHNELSSLEIATDLGNKRWLALNDIYENGEKHSAWWCKRKAQEGLGIK